MKLLDNKNKCAKQTTIAIIVNKDKCWVGQNECHAPQEVCPREGMTTGVGYELCKTICKQKYHAEVSACLRAGENAKGGVLYLIGHYYCCEPCLEVIKKHGIETIHIVKNTSEDLLPNIVKQINKLIKE